MRIILRAYDEHGYQKDIVVASEKQFHMTVAGIRRGPGSGMLIDQTEFPEVRCFEIIITDDSGCPIP